MHFSLDLSTKTSGTKSGIFWPTTEGRLAYTQGIWSSGTADEVRTRLDVAGFNEFWQFDSKEFFWSSGTADEVRRPDVAGFNEFWQFDSKEFWQFESSQNPMESKPVLDETNA